MKFSSQFEASQFEEWRKKYLRYQAIKQHIDTLFPAKPTSTENSTIFHVITHRERAKKSKKKKTGVHAPLNAANSDNTYGAIDSEERGERTTTTTSNNNNKRFPLSASSSHPHPPSHSSSSDSDSLLPLQERADQIMTKLLHELHKIDDFYRQVEGELVVGFQSLKAQIATAVVERKTRDSIAVPATSSGSITSRNGNGHGNGHGNGNGNSSNHLSINSAPADLGGDGSYNRFHSSNNESDHAHPSHHSRRHSADLSEALSPLKGTFIHLLRRQTMLIHYVDINLYAFSRLLKFFEKRSGLIGVEAKFTKLIQTRYVATSRVLEDELIPATYQLFADYYEAGDVERAKVFLLAKLAEAEYDRVDTFFLGIKIGVMIMLIIWNIMLLVRPLPGETEVLSSLVAFAPVYRACGLLIVFVWFWGLLVLIWDTYRIAYVFVFQLNPRNRLTHFQLFNEASNLSIVYLVNCLLLISHYERALDEHISELIYPLSLFAFLVFKLFSPFSFISQWSARKSLMAALAQIIVAPFGKVRFRESYTADVLTSMVKILVDVQYAVCLYTTTDWLHRSNTVVPDTDSLPPPTTPAPLSPCMQTAQYIVPFLCAIPLWWRFQQCMRRYYDTRSRWPHLANALKYAVAHSVVIVSSFHPAFTKKESGWQTYRVMWLLSTIISSLYTFIWDVNQDWGLCQWKPGTHKLLREQLMFPSPAFYYWCIISNLFLRFLWVLTLVPFSFENNSGDDADEVDSLLGYLFQYETLLLPVLIFCELFRRFQWSILRVEWEHLSHGSGFRMSYYVPMFFQQQQAGSTQHVNKPVAGVVLEVISMVSVVVLVAILGAIL